MSCGEEQQRGELHAILDIESAFSRLIDELVTCREALRRPVARDEILVMLAGKIATLTADRSSTERPRSSMPHVDAADVPATPAEITSPDSSMSSRTAGDHLTATGTATTRRGPRSGRLATDSLMRKLARLGAAWHLVARPPLQAGVTCAAGTRSCPAGFRP